MSREVDYPDGSLSRLDAEASFTKPRLRILVADDNEINRYLVSHLLREKGHDVVLVVDGREAVQAAAADEFDLVLMDLQMPEMDGIEATAAIRELKNVSTPPRIVAVTANVMMVDGKRCFERGFNACLSKPIRPRELFATIERVMADRRDQSPVEDSLQNLFGQSENQLDREVLLASVNGNLVLLSKIVQLFLRHYPKALMELRRAIESDDAAALARTAHSLKGGSGTLLTAPAIKSLAKLEEMAKAGLTQMAEPVLTQLEGLLNQNAEMLSEFSSTNK